MDGWIPARTPRNIASTEATRWIPSSRSFTIWIFLQEKERVKKYWDGSKNKKFWDGSKKFNRENKMPQFINWANGLFFYIEKMAHAAPTRQIVIPMKDKRKPKSLAWKYKYIGQGYIRKMQSDAQNEEYLPTLTSPSNEKTFSLIAAQMIQ